MPESFDPTCTFCNELERGFLEMRGERLERILVETEHFAVFPGFGQIVEGYLLIIPKEHVLTMGSFSPAWVSELEELVSKVRKVLTEAYCAPVFFEHAPSAPGTGVACIDHAHLHAMPVNADVSSELSRTFSPQPISSLQDLQAYATRKEAYYFFETQEGKRAVYSIREIVPSQMIRKLIAEKIGVPEKWNWKKEIGLPELKKTVERLRGRF